MIAAGVRPIQTTEDRLWEQTAYYSNWLDRTGLTPAQVDELPYWFIERLPGVWALQEEQKQQR